jgi:hypothetical protein
MIKNYHSASIQTYLIKKIRFEMDAIVIVVVVLILFFLIHTSFMIIKIKLYLIPI